MELMCSMLIQNCMQLLLGRNHLKCKFILFIFKHLKKLITFKSRTYPVYAVGDYTPGQQYYTTTTSNFTTSSSSSNGNANSSSYNIVPVDEAILGVSQSRGSPQTIAASVSRAFYHHQVFYYS